MKVSIEIDKRLGWRIKQKRKYELEMTQDVIAEHMGISKSYVSRIERGNVRISKTTAHLFAIAMGVDLDFFGIHCDRELSDILKKRNKPKIINDFEALSEFVKSCIHNIERKQQFTESLENNNMTSFYNGANHYLLCIINKIEQLKEANND